MAFPSSRQNMKRMLILAAVGLLVTGCASSNVNPPQARAKTGYVDLYADSSGELRWQVARFDDRAHSFKHVFSEWELPPDRVLRPAFRPGQYRLRVMFTNRVVREPGLVDVEVKDGMITPVHVVLIPEGATQVETRQEQWGTSWKGRYGRGTKVSTSEASMYRVSAEADALLPYQVREQTSYGP